MKILIIATLLLLTVFGSNAYKKKNLKLKMDEHDWYYDQHLVIKEELNLVGSPSNVSTASTSHDFSDYIEPKSNTKIILRRNKWDKLYTHLCEHIDGDFTDLYWSDTNLRWFLSTLANESEKMNTELAKCLQIKKENDKIFSQNCVLQAHLDSYDLQLGKKNPKLNKLIKNQNKQIQYKTLKLKWIHQEKKTKDLGSVRHSTASTSRYFSDYMKPEESQQNIIKSKPYVTKSIKKQNEDMIQWIIDKLEKKQINNKLYFPAISVNRELSKLQLIEKLEQMNTKLAKCTQINKENDNLMHYYYGQNCVLISRLENYDFQLENKNKKLNQTIKQQNRDQEYEWINDFGPVRPPFMISTASTSRYFSDYMKPKSDDKK